MVKTLEDNTTIEFNGPNFNLNGYCNAQYRASTTTCTINDTTVPTRIEALTKNNEWKQHPVVFIHYGSYQARKKGNGLLITFLPEGKCASRPYSSCSDRDFYKKAQEIGLTRGETLDIKVIPKEEE